ncbi:MAG: hypothetical protein C0626_08980 [Arcobacter sp.]|nr:MAG: hypothetical protein C0626_08980 [Arcobacter sp.]
MKVQTIICKVEQEKDKRLDKSKMQMSLSHLLSPTSTEAERLFYLFGKGLQLFEQNKYANSIFLCEFCKTEKRKQ